MKSQITTDHERIRQWARARRASPARIAGAANPTDPGSLRFKLVNGYSEYQLEAIGWEEFFLTFEQAKLALMYQERREDGTPSTFNKLVSREQGERRR